MSLDSGIDCFSRQPLKVEDLVPNAALRKNIPRWKECEKRGEDWTHERATERPSDWLIGSMAAPMNESSLLLLLRCGWRITGDRGGDLAALQWVEIECSPISIHLHSFIYTLLLF